MTGSKPRIAFFGSSILSSYWNGAATYYRGIIRALHARGYDTTFFEPDAYGRQQRRDLEEAPPWVRLHVYENNASGVSCALELARTSDLIVKASGVGVNDELLEEEVLKVRRPDTLVAFWDVDAPATLDRLLNNPSDPFRALIPKYDVIFTYGGGNPVVRVYTQLGAKTCVPIYNALDTSTHYPVEAHDSFRADLSFLGNRLPDRERRVDEFFFRPAAQLQKFVFLLAGSGWHDKPKPPNVRYIDHLYSAQHNAFNCSTRVVLNVTRDSMASYGFSPATRIFEAAGAAACIISDYWEGMEAFFEPGREILLAHSGDEVSHMLSTLSSHDARKIGSAALERALREHTYDQRAGQIDSILMGRYSVAAK